MVRDMFKFVRSIAAIGVACTSVCALADEIEVDVQTGDRIVVTDRDSGRVLYDQRTLRLYDSRKSDELVVPTVSVVPHPTGMDLVYTYTNDRGYTRPLADMRIGVFALEDELIMQNADMRGGDDLAISHDNRPTIAYTYPSNIYSPVYVLREQNLAMGLSVHYPMMEYQHDVQIRLASAPEDGPPDQPQGWMFTLRVSTLDGDTQGKKGWICYPAAVGPRQTQSYTVAIRFTNRSREWVRTLVPYREYFRGMYGGVHYVRREHAILGYTTGDAADLREDNQFGFRSEQVRPDIHGFGPMVQHMLRPQGWREIMLVKATGQFYTNRNWNYPFLFASELDRSPEFQTAFDPVIGLASLPMHGRELSLLWGRALEVAEEWDPVNCETFDLFSQDHRNRAFAELDAADRLGATTIGLDCYSHHTAPVWETYVWLKEMQRRYPFQFVIEPMASDVLHTLAPTQLRGWEERESKLNIPSDIYHFTGPHLLADFLLPGHECVLAMRYTALEEVFGIEVTQALIDFDVLRFASWGFRPEMFTEFDLTREVRAAKTWLSTVPEDLQIPEKEWVTLDAPPLE
ncbi:MAG TPA: hypothetical protein VFF69_11235 [Phycisphaerales bacterium]|nr:hypothetical protein [Phycisphaerales bacterium]